MLLNKTTLAREALQSGRGANLGLVERRILIIADGRRSLNDVVGLLGADGQLAGAPVVVERGKSQ